MPDIQITQAFTVSWPDLTKLADHWAMHYFDEESSIRADTWKDSDDWGITLNNIGPSDLTAMNTLYATYDPEKKYDFDPQYDVVPGHGHELPKEMSDKILSAYLLQQKAIPSEITESIAGYDSLVFLLK